MFNAAKFLPAVNGQRLTPLNFDLTIPSFDYTVSEKPLPWKSRNIGSLDSVNIDTSM